MPAPDSHFVRLHSFSLTAKIGAGGMGAIYAGLHRPTGAEVAVKVVRGEPDAMAIRRFRREVRAHAALGHPAIVRLLDYGTIDERAHAESEGVLSLGCPYVVMERADIGTLRDVAPQTWEDMRDLLRHVLEGLAHAHARGVIHRDLKPANILAFSGANGSDVKLTDFGIAHALSSIQQRPTSSLGTIIGTPKYMAPEQLLGRWRDLGPWTDLYAVGCIAYEMACGRPAHSSGGGVKSALAQVTRAPEALQPTFEVPSSLQGWIFKALEVQPEDRFQRASEALAALDELDDDPDIPAANISFDALSLDDTTGDTVPLEAIATIDASSPDPLGPADDLPTPPEQWADAESIAPPDGAGLGLFGLREPPFVGREAEREALWSAFVRCAQQRRFEVVVLSGEAGIGKSRLAQWVTTRSHEVGSAHVLPLGDFTRRVDGLEALLRCWRMPRDQIYAHLLSTLPRLNAREAERDYDARALTEILSPSESLETSPPPRFTFRSGQERIRVLHRLIQRLALQRPTVIWMDDLHESEPALDLLEHLVSNPIDRLFVLATCRSDLVAPRSRLADRLDRLRSAAVVRQLDVEVFDEPTSAELASQLVALPAPEIQLLVERMGGNPLLGFQLLASWVERGLLRVTDAGAALDVPAIRKSPADIHTVWRERVDRIARDADDPRRFRDSLELAATLGLEVDQEVWTQLCADGDVDPALWELLLPRGLARTTETGWRFTHQVLIDTLCAAARDGGREAELNRRCARAFTPLYATNPRAVAARLASHWIAAKEPAQALEPLFTEVKRLGREGNHHAARRVLLLRAELLDELRVPADDIVRLRNRLELCTSDFRTDRESAEICDELRAILGVLVHRDAPMLTAKAFRLLATASEITGDVPEATRLIALSVAAARESGDDRTLARALFRQTRIASSRGDLRALDELARELRGLATALDDPYLATQTLEAQGWATMAAGEYESARTCFSEALQISAGEGFRQCEAEAHNSLGEAARLLGNYDVAVEHYEAAIAIDESMQLADEVATLELNQALAEIALGRFAVAAERLERVELLFEEFGWLLLRKVSQLGHLAIAAGTRNWDQFELLLHRIQSEDFASYWSEDQQWTASLAKRLAIEGGRPDLAIQCDQLL